MVKSQPKEGKNLTSKHLLNVPKDGFIQKNKNKKFKQIPTGKVPLINGSKKSNSNNMKNNTPQKSPEENKGLRKEDVENLQEFLKKQKKNKNFGEVKENDSINEGIVLQDSIIESTDESESSDGNKSEEEKILPDILGASLADDSDEDDEDYEEDKKVQVNKGVKMFDGVRSNDSIVSNEDKDDSMTEDSDDEVDDDDDYDDDEDDEEEEEEDDTEDTESENEGKTDGSSVGSLKVLLGDSLSEDEDDEDFDDFDENNETDDTTDEDEKFKNEGSGLLKTLVADTTIEDDNDDDDFVQPTEDDEDDDISDEEDEEEGEVEGNRSLNSRQDKDSSLGDFKENERTIFVGNLPKDVTKKQLQKLFKQFGKIDAIRLRGKISKSLDIPKRVAAITNDLHPKMKSVYAYIRFESEESTKKALSVNGRKFEGNYIRVDMSMKSNDRYETKKSVFIGNLHFNVDDDSVRNHFKRCGEIQSVRIIRDNQTGVGKGFGYVNFKSEDAVALALELDGTTILNREIRVKPNIDQDKRTKGKYGKRYSAENNHNFSHKKLKNTAGASVTIRNKENAVKRITKKQKLEKKETSPQQGNNFQGQKSDVNKKKSKNKFDKKKKLLAEKLMAKPKKSN
ncbi:RNA-binding protein 34-like [Bombus vosnesenskii]|uniref:RNA-binding protein 34-like n=1 Tax=Bombus vosnesenskii TaxID=207650 RepID=A0A6J3JW95_9HYME|nr:RNA-binding protein 34-like [Bombus vosnesenskii]XP_033345033.1 RNA-binding protein 34-like [Bombus vosnesenskii]